MDDEIQLVRSGLGRFKDGLVRIPLSTVDVSETGSMTEAHPDDVPGTSDYSKITPEFAETLLEDVVAWMSDFVKGFESFSVPLNKPRRE